MGATTMGDRARLPNRREQGLQRALADHLRARAQSNDYWFHPAGPRTGVESAILKVCGVRAGKPDIICIEDWRTLGLKTAHGRLRKAQHVPHDEMRQAGAEVAAAIGWDDAIGQPERWQLLRGSVQ